MEDIKQRTAAAVKRAADVTKQKASELANSPEAQQLKEQAMQFGNQVAQTGGAKKKKGYRGGCKTCGCGCPDDKCGPGCPNCDCWKGTMKSSAAKEPKEGGCCSCASTGGSKTGGGKKKKAKAKSPKRSKSPRSSKRAKSPRSPKRAKSPRSQRK